MECASASADAELECATADLSGLDSSSASALPDVLSRLLLLLPPALLADAEPEFEAEAAPAPLLDTRSITSVPSARAVRNSSVETDRKSVV